MKLNVKDILKYGDEVISRSQAMADRISDSLEIRQDYKDLMNQFDKIFTLINLEKLNQPEVKTNLFSKVLSLGKKGQEKYLEKYTTVKGHFETIRYDLEQWKVDIEKNVDALQQFQQSNYEYQEQLEELLSKGQEMLDDLDNETLKKTMELRLADITYAIENCKNTDHQINIELESATKIYLELQSIYKTTMSTIQNAVNMYRISHNNEQISDAIEEFKQIRNDMITKTSEQVVKVAEKSAKALGYKPEDFQVIHTSMERIRIGMANVRELEERKQDEIKRLTDGHDS